MAYFNHAFAKSWLATDVLTGGEATSAFTAGDFALVDGRTWEEDSAADIATAKHLAYLVGGNFHSADSIGNNPGHGGYQESIKSKGINFNYISRLGFAPVVASKQGSACLTVGSTCAPCGENLFLRMDVKGSPALRFLNRNAYAIGDSSGDAAANGGPLPALLCCADGQEYVDPALALAAALQMTIADPIVAPFVAEAGNVSGFGAIVAGTGYTTDTNVATTGGSGSGLTLDTTDDGAGGIASVALGDTIGSGYVDGDVVTVTGGGADATVELTVTTAGMVVIEAGVETAYTIAEVLDGTYTPFI